MTRSAGNGSQKWRRVRIGRLLHLIISMVVVVGGVNMLAACKTTDRMVDCAPGYHNSAGPDSDCVPNSPLGQSTADPS